MKLAISEKHCFP